MGDDECMELAFTLIDDYWSMKLEELLLLCKNIRQAKYGTFFRFDQPTFFDCLNKFLNEADLDREKEYLDNKVQGSDVRQTDNTPVKLGTLLTKEDLNEMDRAKRDGK